MYRKNYRKRKGHSIAELGPALFMILIIMVLPLACLASLGIRYTIMFYAVRQAAREASKCTQFINNASPYQLSARNRATQVLNLFANSGGANGLRVVACNTYADVMTIAGGVVTRYGPTSPIPAAVPISTVNNVYNITVQVDALVSPLFNGGAGWFKNGGGIPGLTQPFPVRIICASMCEKPEGLKQ